MITASTPHNYNTKANIQKDCSLGNILFVIAGIIGIATKNGYRFGFERWVNQEFFVNPLPGIGNRRFKRFQMPINYKEFDIGFRGFDVPDNVAVNGYLGSEKYFSHCEDLVRHYLTMKDICKPYQDCILMHYRNYNLPAWTALDHNYYLKALQYFPSKRVIVITDNIEAAKQAIKEDFEYVSNSPIMDFYLLSHAEYLVMGNSSFSWMAAWMSRAKTVAPKNWYAGPFSDCPTDDLYCENWILV